MSSLDIDNCSLLVDAVGTLIVPSPSAAETYCRVALGHRVDRERQRVASRLRCEIGHQQKRAAEQPTSAECERQLWRRIVQQSLELSDAETEQVFPDLWDAFADPASWTVVPDAIESVNALRERGLFVAVASNFDSRLNLLWSRWAELPQDVPIHTSETLGWRKPHLSFYEAIDDHLPRGARLVIGDELHGDVLAPCSMGWQAIWLTSDDPHPRLPPRARHAANWREVMQLIEES